MKPVPTIDVNLNKYCEDGIHCRHAGGHEPLPIPCPIRPSVTFEVRLGKCTCPSWMQQEYMCTPSCPARPIRVACAIGSRDGTWASSFVADAYVEEEGGRRARDATPEEAEAAKDRWLIVVALVTGKRGVDGFTPPPQCFDLMVQRDAVFAALADMARAEEACLKAEGRLSLKIVGRTLYWEDGNDRPSQRALERYVERLIEQVGILEGGQ